MAGVYFISRNNPVFTALMTLNTPQCWHKMMLAKSSTLVLNIEMTIVTHKLVSPGLYFSAQEDRRTLESKIANLERENSDLRRDIRELRVNFREITMDYRDLDYDYQHLLVDSPNEPIRGYRGTYYHINSIMIILVWHRFINRYNTDVFNH